MGNTNRTWASILITVIAFSCISLLAVTPANAQTVAKPAVPEFTLRYVDHSYDVPPTTTSSIDQYTGKTVTTTQPGYRVENKTVEVTITNQPFTPYTDMNGNQIGLSYNVRVKGYFGTESDWEQPFNQTIRNGIYGFTKQHPQSNSTYTVIAVPSEFKIGDVVDFQVQTLEGYYTPWEPLPVVMGTSQFSGKSSDWSSTQTITIGQAANPNTPSPTVTASSSPTTATTPVITPVVSQMNSDSTELVALPLGTLAVIIALIVLLAIVVLVLVLRSNRGTH